MATAKKTPFYEKVANEIIGQLEKGTAPWQKPWGEDGKGLPFPRNASTGKRYRGGNALYLMAVGANKGYQDNRWVTYKQAQAMGAQVRKGEKGTSVEYWKWTDERPVKDDQGNTVKGDDGKPLKKTVKLNPPRTFYATVFNAEQVENMPAAQKEETETWQANDRAETVLKNSGAVIRHDQADGAFYRPGSDTIHLPPKPNFDDPGKYYATALHELGHWTGHHSRLDRDLTGSFGSPSYAKEELRAEISSMMVGDTLGTGHDPGQHVAYVGSWIKALKEDPKEIMRAAADAEKIHDLVVGFEKTATASQDAQQRLDNDQVQALSDLVRSVRQGEINREGFEDLAKGQGAALPAEWSGKVAVVAMAMDREQGDPVAESADQLGVEPEFYSVYADDAGEMSRLLGDFKTAEQAEDFAADIRQVADLVADKDIAAAWGAGDIEQANRLAKESLDLELPDDWNGNVQIQANVTVVVDGEKYVEPAEGKDPEFWGVYAQHDNGMHQWVADHDTESQAQVLADRLANIRSLIEQQGRQGDPIEAIEQAHQEALDGYSPLDSWKTLSETAANLGLTAKAEFSKPDDLGDVTIFYHENDGTRLPVETALALGDGKAATSVEGVRLHNTWMTSTSSEQGADLQRAVTLGRSLSQGELKVVRDLAEKEGWRGQVEQDDLVLSRDSADPSAPKIRVSRDNGTGNLPMGADAVVGTDAGTLATKQKEGLSGKSKALSVYLKALDGQDLAAVTAKDTDQLQVDLVKQAAKSASDNAKRYGQFPGRSKAFEEQANDLIGASYHLGRDTSPGLDNLLNQASASREANSSSAER